MAQLFTKCLLSAVLSLSHQCLSWPVYMHYANEILCCGATVGEWNKEAKEKQTFTLFNLGH